MNGEADPTVIVSQLAPGTKLKTGNVHVSKDGHDVPLTFVYAKQLRKLRFNPEIPRGKAVLAFIRALPPNTPIVLYWN